MICDNCSPSSPGKAIRVDKDLNCVKCGRPFAGVLNEAKEKNMLEVHARALCAHCECLSMNAENMQAVMLDYSAPYNDGHYIQVLQKWNLINEKGEPTF